MSLLSGLLLEFILMAGNVPAGILDTGSVPEAVETAAAHDREIWADVLPWIIGFGILLVMALAVAWRHGSLRNRYNAHNSLLSVLLRSLEIRDNINPLLEQLEYLSPEPDPSLKAKDQLMELLRQLVFDWKETGFSSRSDGTTALVAIANYLATTKALGKHSHLTISTNAKLDADQVARLRSSEATLMWFVTPSAQLNDVPMHQFSLAFRILRRSADGSPVIVIYPRSWSSTAADLDDCMVTEDPAATSAAPVTPAK